MKPTIVTYELGTDDNICAVHINTKDEKIFFIKGQNQVSFSTSEVDTIQTILANYKRMLVMPNAAPLPPASPPQKAVADPMLAPAPEPPKQLAHQTTQDIGDRDMFTQNMYVVRTADGRFFPRTVPSAGQMAQLVADAADARMFELQQDAMDIARLYPGANIIPFRDVATYRIAIIAADGGVTLYAGPGLPASAHPNNAIMITGRTTALDTAKTIQLKHGERTALMPVIS
jgi:hypothetical protein